MYPPKPLTVLKRDVDGFSIDKPGLAGIDGVYRDHNGLMMSFLSAHIGIKDSNEAELLVTIKALE